MRGPVVALLLVALLSAGCVAPTDVTNRTGGAPVPTQGPPNPLALGLPNLTLAVEDARLRPLDPPRVRYTVTLDRPLDRAADLATGWSGAHDSNGIKVDTLPRNTTTWSTEHALPDTPGNLSYRFETEWDSVPASRQTLNETYTVWVPVRLILNASEKYAEGQNVFRTDHLIPFASWDDESALHILRRAAQTYGFTIKTHYRADFESYFVDAINGTAFRWELEPAGISRNWMILIDDKVSSYAVDDTFPEANATLEFRYVRCYATGNCDDL